MVRLFALHFASVKTRGGGGAEKGVWGPGERAVVVILPGQEEALQRRLGELAGHVAPDAAEASGVGRAVTTFSGLSVAGRRGPGRCGPWCRGSGDDDEVLGVEGAVAAVPGWRGPF